MADPRAPDLAREARVFTAALIGARPTGYVIREYARGHSALPLAPVQGFDAVLIRVALGGPGLTRLADAYARLLARRSILRRKLALLLAILESAAPSDEAFAALASPVAVTVVRLGITGVGAVLVTVAGVVLFAPLHFVSRLAAGRV